MIGYLKFHLTHWRGLAMDCDCACASAPPAPDYSAVAAASEESAKIMAELGREQLAESRRQYDLTRATSDQVAAAELDLMKQSKEQGDDYYSYMLKYQRPTEEALQSEAMAAGSEERQQAAADQAVADSRRGFTGSINTALRQGKRYGMGADAMALNSGALSVAEASSEAAAATGARAKEKELGFAKKMDVAGLYRNLPGASQGAYATAINSGNSAVSNTMAPGAALLTGMNQGAGITGQGQQLRLSGLGNVLQAQTSYANTVGNINAANAQMMAGGSDLGGLGSLLGGAASLYKAFGPATAVASDRRLKCNIVPAGVAENGLPLYEFNYLHDPDTRYRGVMADDVAVRFPEAVEYDASGFARVRYDMIGVPFEEVH